MLEMIIAIFPGILATLIYCRTNKKLQWGKLLFYILFYTLFTNLCILLGLYLIGMRSFNLFDMSTRFKVKWVLLEFFLVLPCTMTIVNVRKLNLSACKNAFIRLFPAILFFIVTYVVFTPSSLFLGNIEEFSLNYTKIIPIILSLSLICAIGIYLAALCLTNENFLHIFIAFLFSITLSLYVQGNFLNPELPSLDGTEVNWGHYHIENVISVCFWIICLIICLIFSCLRKEKTEKVMKYIAYFISGVQMLTLIALIFTTKYDDRLQSGYSKDDLFTIGSENNIVIFVVDTLQADAIEEYISSDAYTDGILDDFTFFNNAVSGGAPTSSAMPVLTTGIEYDPTQPGEEYLTEIWEETELYHDLHDNNYSVCFFTTHYSISDPPKGVIDNFEATGEYWINDYSSFSFQLYKLVNFYLMPQYFKPYFWLSDNAIKETISDGRYTTNDVQFYAELQETNELETKYEKTFRLYHLNGVHKPYRMNENIEYTEEPVTEQQTLQGDIKILHAYFEKLKKADVYEESTIIIVGDHGRYEEGNIGSNPAVLIKLPYETHKLTCNSSPIHFRNLVATMAAAMLDDYSHYGPSVYDISEDSDVERLHSIEDVVRVKVNLENAYNDPSDCLRLIINGDAGNGDYQIWNPYEINRISYKIGDIIDFTTDNLYADQINYRLYKENGMAIASNELSICFELENIPKEDLEFHFTYSHIYNDSQKIRLYANGNKVENIICTQDGTGKENVSIIPKDYMDDEKLIIRMVFPNAVTPNQLDRNNTDTRILSVGLTSMWLE